MCKQDYIGTVIIKNQVVNIGLDDYGQCYYFDWVDEAGNGHVSSCGSYNSNYLEDIYSCFDSIGTFISLYGEDAWQNEIKAIEQLRDTEGKDNIHRYEMYQQEIDEMNTTDYEIYDFNKLYKKLRNKSKY